MVKIHKCLSLDYNLVLKAKVKGINVSKVVNDFLKDYLDSKEVEDLGEKLTSIEDIEDSITETLSRLEGLKSLKDKELKSQEEHKKKFIEL